MPAFLFPVIVGDDAIPPCRCRPRYSPVVLHVLVVLAAAVVGGLVAHIVPLVPQPIASVRASLLTTDNPLIYCNFCFSLEYPMHI